MFVLYGIMISKLILNSYHSFEISMVFLLLPLTLWFVLAIHEIMHALAFSVLGFRLKELRIGLLLIQFRKPRIKLSIESAGFFRGYCTADYSIKQKRWKTIVALLAGGVSGLLISLISFAFLMGKIISPKWDALLAANILCGLYTFGVALVNPRGTDRVLIERMLKARL